MPISSSGPLGKGGQLRLLLLVAVAILRFRIRVAWLDVDRGIIGHKRPVKLTAHLLICLRSAFGSIGTGALEKVIWRVTVVREGLSSGDLHQVRSSVSEGYICWSQRDMTANKLELNIVGIRDLPTGLLSFLPVESVRLDWVDHRFRCPGLRLSDCLTLGIWLSLRSRVRVIRHRSFFQYQHIHWSWDGTSRLRWRYYLRTVYYLFWKTNNLIDLNQLLKITVSFYLRS